MVGATSEQAGVNLRALRCGTERITDNEDSEYWQYNIHYEYSSQTRDDFRRESVEA